LRRALKKLQRECNTTVQQFAETKFAVLNAARRKRQMLLASECRDCMTVKQKYLATQGDRENHLSQELESEEKSKCAATKIRHNPH